MRYRCCVCWVSIVAAAFVVWAQEGWQEHNDAGEMAFAYGDLEQAESEFRAALEIAQQLPAGDRRLETSLRNLARLLEHRQRLDQAQPLYELLLAAQEAHHGADSPQLLDTLRAAGRVALQAGDVPTGEAHLQRFVEVAEASGKADPDELRTILSTLSRMCVLQERSDEALALQRRAVELLDRERLTPTEQAAEVETLAQLELMHGSAVRGEQLLHEAITLRAKDQDTQEELPAASAAEVLAGAASAAFGAGRSDVARRLAQQALEAGDEPGEQLQARQVLADVAWLAVRRGSSRLADLLEIASDSAELGRAEEQLLGLLEMQQAQAADDPAAWQTIGRLVQVRVLRGDAAGAARLQQQLAAEYRAAGSPLLAQTLDDLVVLFTTAGQTSEALRVDAELLQLLEQQHGPDDPRLLPSLRRQVELLTAEKRKKEAKLLKRRIKQLERASGR